MTDIHLGEMINYYRKQNGWTMKQLGKKMNKTESAISLWINNKRSPMVDDLDKLSKLFNVSPEILMFGNTKNCIIEKTVETMKQLEEPRQKLVLDTANSQLKEQKEEQERKKVISLPNDDTSPLTEDELQEAVDQAVAFDGKPFDDREKEIVKQLLRQAWEEKHGRG